MIKKFSTLALGAAFAVAASATPVTPEAALMRARGDAPARARGMVQKELKLVHTAKTENGVAAAYVFNTPGQPGFTVLAADDVAMPVLGYSDTDSFDAANIPPQLTWWLSELGRQMEYANQKGVGAYKAPVHAQEMAAIAPLVQTKWDQTAPYNNLTPKVNGSATPTGCVATSFAQAMNYFKYPEKGEGTISYKWGSKTMTLPLERRAFEWDKLRDVYVAGDYSSEEATAVAFLMMACGYSVEMNYAVDGSGALSYRIVQALTKYFKYSKDATYENRSVYTADEWNLMVYNNLKDYGPVIYNGTSPLSGGHSFLVDGYDGNGYYHLNWGWGGMSDGYYALNVLTPGVQGTGGAMGGFNYSQDAVFNMHKPTSEEEQYPIGNAYQYGATTGSLSGKVLTLKADESNYAGWSNISAYDINIKFGLQIKGGDYSTVVDLAMYPGNMIDMSISPNIIYMTGKGAYLRTTLPDGLADGRYTATIVTKDRNRADADYQPILVNVGYPNYVILNVNNGNYTVENSPVAQLSFDEITLDSELYYKKYAKLRAKVTNNSDYQLSECIAPTLINGTKADFQADAFLVTVDPHSTLETDWIVNFLELNTSTYSSPTTYKLSIYNEDTGKYVADCGNVTMSTLSGATTIKFDGISIEGAETQNITIDGTQYKNVRVVPNFDDLKVNFQYSVTKGYLDSNVTLGIYERMGTDAIYVQADDPFYSEQPFMTAGDSKDLNFNVSFPQGSPDKIYYLRAQYVKSGSYSYLGQIAFMSLGSGVDGIAADEIQAPAEYFNLQGLPVSNPAKGQLLIKRQNGKSSKVIY